MLKGQPERPANMLEIVAINQGRKAYSYELVDPPELAPEEAVEMIGSGIPILDVRSGPDYSGGHIEGSFFVPAGTPPFEQYAGWILPVSSPFLLAVGESEDRVDIVTRLAIVGLDRQIRGIIRMDRWKADGRPLSRVDGLSVVALHDRWKDAGVEVLDVRESSEWESGHIEGAKHINFKHLGRRWQELASYRNDPIAVICDSGMRSLIACSILQRHRFSAVYNVQGGMTDWSRRNFPVVTGGQSL